MSPNATTVMLLGVLGLTCALGDPLVACVLVPVVMAIEWARKRAVVEKVNRKYGSQEALIDSIERDTQRLHGLYRKHGIPESEWEH